MSAWIDLSAQLPADGARVLAFVPGHQIVLPGKLEIEVREVIVLRFHLNFFADDQERCAAHGAHFFSGEGVSNQYFSSVSHWQAIPSGPGPS
jgi:hypothetical protein